MLEVDAMLPLTFEGIQYKEFSTGRDVKESPIVL